MRSEEGHRWELSPTRGELGKKGCKTDGLLLAGTNIKSLKLKRQIDDADLECKESECWKTGGI